MEKFNRLEKKGGGTPPYQVSGLPISADLEIS